MSESGATMSLARLVRLGAGLLLLSLPAWLWLDRLPEAAALTHLVESGWPALVSERALLVYALVPITIVGLCVLLMSPGLLLAPALRGSSGLGVWLANALLIDLVVVTLGARAASVVLGAPVVGRPFAALVTGIAAAAAALLWWRIARGARIPWPLAAAPDRVALAGCLAAPAVLAAVLAPKLLWESFNGDGVHAFESARLLLYQSLPFFPPEARGLTLFPDMRSMLFAFPASWFMRLCGELELAARLPMLLALPALFGAIYALARGGRGRGLPAAEQALVWALLVVYTVVQAFSATYSRYSADLAMPGAQDTLLMVCVLGAVVAFDRRALGWLALYSLASFVSLPSGWLLLALFAAAVVVTHRPLPRGPMLVLGGCLAGFVLVSALGPAVLAAFGVETGRSEYEAVSLFERFRYLQLGDVRRVAFAAVPAGIVPALTLFLWRKHDPIGRALILVTLGYFALFYVQASVSLHHFVPAMLLPVAICFRADGIWGGRRRRVWLAAASAGAALALALSLPTDATPNLEPRRIGAAIDDRVGSYSRFDGPRTPRARLLSAVTPLVEDTDAPESLYRSDWVTLHYYAHHGPRARTRYVIELLDAPIEDSAVLLAERGRIGLFWLEDSGGEHPPPRPPGLGPPGSRLYQLPPEVTLGLAPGERDGVVDLLALCRRLRLCRGDASDPAG